MGDRISLLLNELGIKQYEFAERIGVTETAVSAWKNGRRNITEQTIKAICREFNVDYIWLTTGEGEMFSENDNQALEVIDRVLSGENDFAKRVFKAFAAFDESDWKTLEKFIDMVSTGKEDEKKEAD